MTKLRPTARLLAGVAGALALVAFLAWRVAHGDSGASAADLIWIAALMLLLELPAFWWRGRGGSGPGTLAAALAGPLLVFESYLAFSAWKYRHVGGDLQDIEQILMVVVLVPILITAAIAAILAVALVEQDEPAD